MRDALAATDLYLENPPGSGNTQLVGRYRPPNYTVSAETTAVLAFTACPAVAAVWRCDLLAGHPAVHAPQPPARHSAARSAGPPHHRGRLNDQARRRQPPDPAVRPAG